MEDSILKFAEQFDYEPKIVNSEKLGQNYKNFVMAGMGGSHLAGGLLHTYKPGVNLYIHRDYGTPEYDEDFCRESLFIASSYSGNTEEIVDFLDESYSKGYDVVVVSTGGKLIDFAKENQIPYIEIPDTGIQPRLAVGYSIVAVASLVLPEALPDLRELKNTLKPNQIADSGQELAESLKGKIPIIYTSTKNRAIGYNWKIKMNETGKIPSFNNVLPELNHNEMQGFDFVDENKKLSEEMHFIFIREDSDHPRISKRMDVLEGQLQEKGLSVTNLYMEGQTKFEKIFSILLLGSWTAFYLSKIYGTEPEQVPLIEEFKKRILE